MDMTQSGLTRVSHAAAAAAAHPACVTLYYPHSHPLEAQVQLSGLPRVFVHTLAFSSTPSHDQTTTR